MFQLNSHKEYAVANYSQRKKSCHTRSTLRKQFTKTRKKRRKKKTESEVELRFWAVLASVRHRKNGKTLSNRQMRLLAFEQTNKVLGSVRTESVQPNHCCLRFFMARLSDFRSATDHYSMNAFGFSISSTRKELHPNSFPLLLFLRSYSPFSVCHRFVFPVSFSIRRSPQIATFDLHILLLFFTSLNRPSDRSIDLCFSETLTPSSYLPSSTCTAAAAFDSPFNSF